MSYPLTTALRVGSDLAAAIAVGGLASAAVLLPPGRHGIVSRAGRLELRRAGIAAGLWAVLATAQGLTLVANSLGISFGQVLHPGIVGTYLWALPSARALVLAAVLALFVAAANLVTTTTGAALCWLLPAGLAVALPVISAHGASHAFHALALTSGLIHVWTTTLWLGVALVSADQTRRGVPGAKPATELVIRATPWLAGIVLGSGVAASWARLGRFQDLFSTNYGVLVLISVGLLLAVVVLRQFARKRFLLGQVIALGLALVAAAVMAATSYPRPVPTYPSVAETILGGTFPAQPNAMRILFGWAPDPFFLTLVILGGWLYLYAARRLHARGDKWPWLRTLAWLTGSLALLWATCGGVARYAPVSFSLHMLQHMSLSMVAPILLTLGAPVTLTLRSLHPSHGLRRGPREWIVWALHTPVSRFVSHPIYVLAIYTVGLYGLYFTPLFNTMMHAHIGHVIMQLHFLGAGLLFYWVIIGIDPGPRRVPHWARLVLVMLTLVIHAFFALAIMLATHPMVSGWYTLVKPPWISDVVHDQYVGGGIAWAFGEVPTLLVLIALAVQWSRSDDREAARHDRKAERDGDAELTAYNEQLAMMNRRND